MAKSEFVYTTYIKTTPDKLWHALTNVEFMKQYWFGTHCQSEWKAGSPWKMVSDSGQIFDDGVILESNPPKHLAIKWQNQWKPELTAEGFSLCTFDIEAVDDKVTKLTVVHSIDKENSKLIEAVGGGWPKILSNLKSLLETGQVVIAEKAGCGNKAA